MRSARHAVILFCSLLPMTALSDEPAKASPPAHCAASTSQAITDASTRLVLQALVHPEQTHNRISMFEQYLANPVTAPNSARQVATNHVRVVLAADRIRSGHYEEARQLLSKIDLSSTVAVDAALLLSESWRLQGDDARAQAWLVRVARRYSSDPKALEGLLLSARDLASSGKMREAWALYNLINDKVLGNVEQVKKLRGEQSELVDQLLETRLDESRSVESQIVKNILQSSGGDALDNMREIIESRQQLDCLSRQDESIKDDAWDESIMAANVTSFQTMLVTEARINEHQLSALKAKLASANEEDKPQIQEDISALEEQMSSLSERLNELKKQQSNLPAASLTKQKQLEQNIKELHARINDNREAIRQQLDSSLQALQKHYRELAAETQLARAELMQLMAANR